MEQTLTLELLNNVSEIDIVYKKEVRVKLSERPQLVSSLDTYKILLHYWDKDKIELIEEFKVLMLNKSNRVLQLFSVSRGGITGTVADPKLILGAALKVGCCNLILAHNHPSGALNPSKQDELLTEKIKQAAFLFDIAVLDHLIISQEGYYSFADEGML